MTKRNRGEEMRAGDHLETPRMGYAHHGLYVGSERVIHYSGFADGLHSGPICLVSLDEFCGGKGFRVLEHDDRVFSHEESVERAFRRLGENRYSLLSNNCEHFVTWCIQGREECRQLREKSVLCAELVRQGVHAYELFRKGRYPAAISSPGWMRSGLLLAAAEGLLQLSGEVRGRGSSDY